MVPGEVVYPFGSGPLPVVPLFLLPTNFPFGMFLKAFNKATSRNGWFANLRDKLELKGYSIKEPTEAMGIGQLHQLWETQFATSASLDWVEIDNPFSGDPFANPDFLYWCNFRKNLTPDADDGAPYIPSSRFTTLPIATEARVSPPDGGDPVGDDIPYYAPVPFPDVDQVPRLDLEVTNFVVRSYLQAHLAMEIDKAVTFGRWGGRPPKPNP